MVAAAAIFLHKLFQPDRLEMIILSRKLNESIVINNDITITVVDIRSDKVRLAVETPREVPVHRYEVWQALRNEMDKEATTDADRR